MAMRGVMICRLLRKFYRERGSLVEAFVLDCSLNERDSDSRSRGDCYPCECVLVEAFDVACAPIGKDGTLFLKVAPFLDVALFFRIKMSGETQETPK